jgi:hypothetical protein
MGMEKSFSRKYWQTAFIVGLITCIFAAFLILGHPRVTALVALISLLIAVLNALFSATPEAPKDQTWLQACLKKMFHVSPLLKITTCIVWLSTVGLIGYGWFAHLQASQIITLKGHVLTAQGNFANNAMVKLRLSSGKELIENAPGGKYSFNQINFSKELVKTVELEATSEDSTKKVRIDLIEGVLNEVNIHLPPGKPPFRIQYFKLNGTAIDQLMRGVITPAWEKGLAGKVFIIPNKTFFVLKSLLDNFSEPFPDYYDHISKEGMKYSDEIFQEEKLLADKRKGSLFFIGVEKKSNEKYYDCRSYIDSFEDFKSWLKPINEWNLYPYIGRKLEESGLLTFYDIKKQIKKHLIHAFSKYATFQDLQNLNMKYKFGKIVNYLLHITKHNMPSDFIPIFIELEEPGCGTGYGWTISFYPRMLEAKIAVIENVKSYPIEIGNLFFKENNDLSLRRRKDDYNVLEN